MKNIVFIFLLCFCGCVNEEIPALGSPDSLLFPNLEEQIFELESVDRLFISALERKVIVNFSNPYASLSQEDQEEIKSIIVTGEIDATLNSDQELIVDPGVKMVGSTICYNLKFQLKNDFLSRNSEICFLVSN